MNDKIKVYVCDFGRKYIYMQYRNPMTGKAVTRSTGATTRKEALKAAGKWEDELREGRYKSPLRITWAEFRQRYEDEVLPGLKLTTESKVGSVFDAIERIINPEKLASVTAERISYFVRVLRSEETEIEERVTVTDGGGRKRIERRKKAVTVTRAESTVRGHLATLKAALNWAKRVGMMHTVPNIDMPKRGKGQKMMKGRPISGEEFERMLGAVDKVRPGDATAWKWFLCGLWWSGLRINEALNLNWDDDAGLSVDLSGKRPMLRIPAECEKGNQERLLPMAPEFAEMLQSPPAAERTGRVFKIAVHQREAASRTVSQIGAAAGVKVNTDARTGKIKFASAHDLRRAFGARWAPRVMPQVLMELMRHESIETTLRFYVGRNAEATADVLWKAVSLNTCVNTATTDGLSQSTQPLTH